MNLTKYLHRFWIFATYLAFCKVNLNFCKTKVCKDNKNTMQNVKEQRVQGLQAFAFCVVTINDEHTKPRLKRKRKG